MKNKCSAAERHLCILHKTDEKVMFWRFFKYTYTHTNFINVSIRNLSIIRTLKIGDWCVYDSISTFYKQKNCWILVTFFII